MKTIMSPKGEIKEVAGFVKEELYEPGDALTSKEKAQEGCDLYNEGRVEAGYIPFTNRLRT